MYKKIGDRTSSKKAQVVNMVSSRKRGQVTIFIIVGVIVLFIFLFLISLTNNFQKKKFADEQELVFKGAFEKEAIRIYVEDCLNDYFVEGLKLLGEQGRIWKSQGGRTTFVPNVNGIEFNDKKIAFAIKNELYPNGEESKYPCKLRDPGDCQYKFPNTTTSFGKKELRTSTLEKDLGTFLHSKTDSCVFEELFGQAAESLGPISEDANFEVKFKEDGIRVKVHYPLKVTSRGEDFSHLSEFDFFFPTKFKQLLDVAVIQPIDWDVQFIDYLFDEDPEGFLGQPTFTYGDEPTPGEIQTDAESYSRLGIELTKSSFEGTDIFEFHPEWGEPDLESYVFRFARQNRPPALDYISRCPVTDSDDPNENYDYLVIPGDRLLNELNIRANARDPDEEDVVGYELPGEFSPISNIIRIGVREFGWSTGFKEIEVKTKDKYLEDSQLVRVKVGTPQDSVCCKVDPADTSIWSPALDGEVCFEDTLPGCYGRAINLRTGSTDLRTKRGFILEMKTNTCNGVTNRCDQDTYQLGDDTRPGEVLCGGLPQGNLFNECDTSIPIECRTKPAWSIQGNIWCSGNNDPANSGCEKKCTTEIVDTLRLGFTLEEKSHVNGFMCGCQEADTEITGTDGTILVAAKHCYDLATGNEGKCENTGGDLIPNYKCVINP